MPRFETYIFFDWSARNYLSPKKPSRDTIRVGELTPSYNNLNKSISEYSKSGLHKHNCPSEPAHGSSFHLLKVYGNLPIFY
jgi:hypothetical protein